MAKKKNIIAPNDKKAVEAMDKQQAEIERIEKLYGDGLPFDQARMEIGIKARTAASIGMMIQNGKDYHRLKAHLPHGEFVACANRTSGKSHVWVCQCMNMAEMVVNTPQILTEVNILNVGQFRALAVFEKPVVEGYLKGGPLGDIPHDEVATMSRGDLEAEARRLSEKEKRLKDSHKKEVEKLNEIIGDLKVRAEDPMQLTPAQRAHQMIRSTYTGEYGLALAGISAGIRKAMSVLADAERTEGIGVQELNEWLNEFVPDSATIMELINQWQAETENPGPIADWRISDLPGGGEPA
jgi:hypothetical protein